MNIKKYHKTILLIICVILLILLIVGLYNNRLSLIDQKVYELIIKTKSSFMTIFFKIITFFASIEWFIILMIMGLIFYKKKDIKIMVIIYIIVTALITLLMKNIFLRDRPYGLMLILEDGYSFPSGHSSISMAFYGLIAYFLYKSDIKGLKKSLLIGLLLVLIFLIGISRIYLGVHFATDVLAGFLVGLICLTIFIYIYKGRRRQIE